MEDNICGSHERFAVDGGSSLRLPTHFPAALELVHLHCSIALVQCRVLRWPRITIGMLPVENSCLRIFREPAEIFEYNKHESHRMQDSSHKEIKVSFRVRTDLFIRCEKKEKYSNMIYVTWSDFIVVRWMQDSSYKEVEKWLDIRYWSFSSCLSWSILYEKGRNIRTWYIKYEIRNMVGFHSICVES